jgi:hypothetical protein
VGVESWEKRKYVLQSSALALTSIKSSPQRASSASPPGKAPGTDALWAPSCMPLGLLPLGTGGADIWVTNVGLVSLGTGGGKDPTGVIADSISVGANYAWEY